MYWRSQVCKYILAIHATERSAKYTHTRSVEVYEMPSMPLIFTRTVFKYVMALTFRYRIGYSYRLLLSKYRIFVFLGGVGTAMRNFFKAYTKRWLCTILKGIVLGKIKMKETEWGLKIEDFVVKLKNRDHVLCLSSRVCKLLSEFFLVSEPT